VGHLESVSVQGLESVSVGMVCGRQPWYQELQKPSSVLRSWYLRSYDGEPRPKYLIRFPSRRSRVQIPSPAPICSTPSAPLPATTYPRADLYPQRRRVYRAARRTGVFYLFQVPVSKLTGGLRGGCMPPHNPPRAHLCGGIDYCRIGSSCYSSSFWALAFSALRCCNRRLD
jgi:hypothetical protein